MEVEPSVVKKELTALKHIAEHAKDTRIVARKLDDIGFDHIPTTQYRSGTQIKTELLTHVSALVATAKQGERADDYIKEAQEVLKVALNIQADDVYSVKLVRGHYQMSHFSLSQLITSINNDLSKFN